MVARHSTGRLCLGTDSSFRGPGPPRAGTFRYTHNTIQLDILGPPRAGTFRYTHNTTQLATHCHK